MRTRSQRLLALAAAATSIVVASGALADEPRSATEPRIMEEPGEVVDVIDAFDGLDVFDVNVGLGFSYEAKSAKILRETAIEAPGLTTGRYTSRLMNVAEYTETTSKLIPRIDLGIYHDLALRLSLPIILSNSRELTDLDGSEGNQDVVLAGSPGERVFDLPFTSPDRSGIEYVGVELRYNIYNQARDATKPTWLLALEGQFPVGEAMHACNANPKSGQIECADPGDVNRNGQADGDFDANDVSERSPGISKSRIGFKVETLLSKRVKYVEPYGGITAMFQFPAGGDFDAVDFESAVVSFPPQKGRMTAGMMFIPWENREKFGRLTFDTRIEGEYQSEGRDYSELYDALGSSDAPSLRNPNYSRYVGRSRTADEDLACGDNDPSTYCPALSVPDTGNPAYFTGLTNVQAHGSVRLSGSVTWQASEFVKFQFGLGYRHTQGHSIGSDKSCNADFKDDLNASGPCRRTNADGSFTSTGVPNPNHRATIHQVGRRFYVDDSNTFDVFASGVAMF